MCIFISKLTGESVTDLASYGKSIVLIAGAHPYLVIMSVVCFASQMFPQYFPNIVYKVLYNGDAYV